MIQEYHTTYIDLRDGDVVIDKSANRWWVSGVYAGEILVGFYLGDPVKRDKVHRVTKPLIAPVHFERTLSAADELVAREAEMPITWDSPMDPNYNHEDAVRAAEELGWSSTMIAEDTPAGQDAREASTEAAPVELIAFADMTPLEMRSHLYLYHGVWADDVQTVKQTTAHHDEVHAGKVKSRTTPHVHKESK